MARLQGYTLDSTLTNEDLVIGSSYDANTGKYTTNNFKLGTLTNFFNQGITSAQLADNAVTAAELNISGNGTSGQCIISDGDGSFSYLTLNHDNLTGFVANEHIDWTTDQGSTNIHAGNYTNTTYSAMGSGNSYAAGLVLAGGSSHGGAFLRKDGTWQVPPDTIYTLPTATDSVKGGVTTGYTTNAKNYQVQSSGTDIYVNVPWTDTTYTAFAGSTSPGTAALVPARDSGATTTKYLREDGDWVVPPDTTTNTFRTVKVDTTNDGTANETIGATEDLQLVGGTAIVLSESAGVVTITGPVESYTAHENISAATSVDNSGRTYIQDITLDSNGHVTGLTSATETITDSFPAWIVRDDDNDDNTLSGSTNIYLKFAAATGTLGTNLTGAGSSGDPYIMTITSPNDNDNTFRTIKVDTDGDGTADNTLTATEDLMLKKGSNITLAEADGVVTISSTDTNTNQLTTFVVEDGDGTEVTISQDKEWKFVEGTGIDIDWTNVSNGTDADPYDLTFTVDLEGTELKSTGETGGSKFLREDGDGTCSWQTIPTDANYYLDGLSFATATGVLTASVNGATDQTVDLDGRYLELSGGTVTGDVIFDSDSFTIQSDQTTDPLVTIKNTTNDATSARLTFLKDRGAAGQDNDKISEIRFTSKDDGNNSTDYALLTTSINDASNLMESGKVELAVSIGDCSNQYLRNGLVLTGGSANDIVDVTLGYGGGTTTTTGGLTVGTDITVSGGDIILSGTGRIQGIDTVSASTDAVSKHYVDTNFNDYTLPIATASALGGVKVGTNLSIDSTTGVLSAGPIALTTVQTAANQAAQLALTCQEGDVVVRTDENKTYMHNGGTASDMNDFTELSSPGNVSSVNTTDGTYINLTPNSATTGAITVTADLSAADGTADTSTRFLSKDNTWDVPAYTSTYTLPIATASALGGIKIGAGLSIDASTGEVTGLEIGTSGSTAMAGNTSIPSGNAIIDWTSSGAGTIHASNYTNTTYSEATSSDAGLMSTTHHDKLDGIAAGAEVNVQSDWNSSSGDNQILNKPTIPSGNQIIDWTATHAEVIHSDNYTNTTYSVGDGGLTENNLTNALKSNYDAAYTHSQAAHAPAGAEANVQSDWNASSGDAKILNKPTIIAVGSGSGDAMAGDTRTISASEVTKLGHIAVTQAVDLDDIETKAGNGNTAHGWGNHASAGYLTSFSEADTLATATGRGATTSTACSFTNTTSFLIGGSGEANLYLGNIISASSSDKGARFHSNNNDFYMDFQGDATQNWFLRDYDGSGGTHDRFGFNFVNGTFTATGDVVAYGTPSDIKWKENIKPIESALDKVTKLEGVTFDWKEDSDTYSMVGIKEDIGFIAQDVQKVIPEIVRENNSGDLSLRMTAVIPVLVQAIKELKEEINELKEKCNGCTC